MHLSNKAFVCILKGALSAAGNFPVLGNAVFDTGQHHILEVDLDGVADLLGIVAFVGVENFSVAGSHAIDENFVAAGADETENGFVGRPVVSACFFEGGDIPAYKINTRGFYHTCESIFCDFFEIFHKFIYLWFYSLSYNAYFDERIKAYFKDVLKQKMTKK